MLAYPYRDPWGNAVIKVKFARKECRPCPVRSSCTHAKTSPRSLGLRTQETYEANRAARQQEQTADWKTTYAQRAGVEGTFAQGNRRSDLRHARYIGLAKTHLQHVAIAAAVSAIRLVAWLQDIPTAATPRSPLACIA
jgi:transposase